MRYLRALAAVVALLVLVAGIPLLLIFTVGNPLTSWSDLAAGDFSDTTVIAVLTAAAYLAWAQFTLTVLVEVLAALTRIHLPERMPPAWPGQRRLVQAVVAAAFLLPPTPSVSIVLDLPSTTVTSAPATAPAAPTGIPSAANGIGHSTPSPSTPSTTYTIRDDGPGTYWDLAEHFLGDGQRWPEIWHLNNGRHQDDGTVMTQPGLLRSGWTVILPSSTAPSVSDNHADTVTVHRGDTLWSIAETHLDNGNAWPDLFQLNKNKPQPRGGHLTNPDLIQPGWTLDLPTTDDDRPRPTAGNAPKTPVPSASSEPSLPATTKPQPTPAVSTPPTTTAPTANPSPKDTTTQAMPDVDHENSAPRSDAGGVQLPGGWVSLPFAAAISALGALVWIRRRRRHHYRTFDEIDDEPSTEDDDDLQPLPAVVDRMRRAVRQHNPDLLEPPEPRTSVTEYTRDPTAFTAVEAGPTGIDLVGLNDLAQPNGLGLKGPGADAAARALLVAVLSSGGATNPDAQGSLVVPEATVTRLVGNGRGHFAGLRRLHITRDLEAALDLLDQIHLERHRTLDEHDADDCEALRSDPTAPPMPQVVLLTDAPIERLANRLTTLLEQGHSTAISAVVLGAWSSAPTATVAADGRTTGDHRTVRLAVLDMTTTAELLGMVSEAQPDTDVEEPLLPSPRHEHEPAPQLATDDAPCAVSDDNVPLAAATPGKTPVRVFGKVAVLDQNEQPVTGLRQHAAGLLVYLAVHRKGADKNDILEALWPDAPLRRAAERLSTEVGNLRRCLRLATPAIDDTTAQPVVNTGGRYHLNADVVDVDLWYFEDAARRAASCDGPADRQEALESAISVIGDELAQRHDYHWLEPVRERQRRIAIQSQLHLADLVAAHDPQRAANLTQSAVAMDPTNEEVSRLAMKAHQRAGDQTAADAELRRLRTALRDIGETPSWLG